MSRCKFCRSFCKSLRRLGRYIGKKCGCVRPSPDEQRLSNPNVSVPVGGTIHVNNQPEVTLPVINCDASSTVDSVANVPVNGTSQENSQPEATLPVNIDPPTTNGQVTDVPENGSSQNSSVSESRTSIIESYESTEAVVQDPDSEQNSGAKVVTGLTIVELNSDEDEQVLPPKPAIEITEELEPIVEFASQVVQPVAVQEESEILTKSTLDQFAYQQYLKQVEEVLQVRIYEELGHGSYGKVFLCKSTQDDAQEYAVKGMMSQYISPKEFRSKWEEEVWTEVKCLNDLKHDNVVLYYDHMFMKHHDYDVNCYAAIKTELLDCTLGNILTERELNPEQVALLGDSLGTVLSWMVDQGYAHHDLKPDNIMFKNLKNLDEDFNENFPQAIPKIIDLGFVHEYRGMGRDEARERSFGLGTPLYASPEKKAFKDGLIKWYNPFKADAYSFGLILLWCLISKREDVLKMHVSARDCLDQYRQAHPEVANSPYLTAIELLIQPEPNDRMHIRDVIALFK